MFPEERRALLVAKARREGRLNVAEIATELAVTQETVRRDLDELEDKGLVKRVHGGAIPVEGSLFEIPLWNRRANFLAEKQAIADAVVLRLAGVGAVFIDEGSTAQVIAETWNPSEPVTVVTAALPTAMSLASKPNTSVFFIGGRVRTNTLAVSDPTGRDQLADLVVDVAIIGANGVSIERGCTCPDAAVAAMKSSAIRAARQIWLTVDSSKLNVNSFIRFATLGQFDCLFTDHDADPAFLRGAEALGVEVVLP